MRKIVISLLLFMSFIGYSQTNGITYQALILNPTGEQLPGVNNSNAPLANKYICLKFTIIDQNSVAEYVETARTTTDEFGMVNLIIGTGEQIGGYATSFSNVLWNANPKRLKVELSATGTCYTYVEISNQPFTAVPFALFAVNSESTAALAALQATVAANASATTAALALKENTANKSTTTTLGTSNVLFPTQNAVKTYVDSSITTVNANNTALQATVTANAAATTAALALKEDAINKSTTTTLGTSNVLFPTQNAVKTYVDNNITTVNAATTALQATVAANAAATTTALALKEDAINKSTTTTLGTSNVLFPTQNAVKTYVDNNITSVNAATTALQATVTANATATTTALATKENTANKSTATTLGTSDVLFPTQNAVKTYVDSNITTVNAATTALQTTVTANATATTTALATKENTANKSTATTLGTSDVLFPTQNAVKTYVDNNIITVNAATTALQTTVTANATATTTALATKENTANKSTATTLGTSDVLFPTQNAVKTYVDTQVASATIADADATTKGKIQLAGDLGGTAASPTVPALALKAPIASPTFTGTVTSPIYASAPQSLTDNATIDWNPSNGLNASVTLGGNRTLNFTTTPAVGSYGTLVITQDATGGRTITLPSTSNKVLGSASTTTIALSSAANAKDILNFYYDGTNCYWNIGQGYGTVEAPIVTNLASSVSGTLAVANGGTGATTLTGIVKGNGTTALTAAVAGTDYQAPLTLTTTGSGAATLSGTTLNIPTTTNYSLPTASASALGGVKVGTNLSIDGSGVLSTSASPNFTGSVTSPIFASTPQALTDAATISWNPSNGLNASVTLAGNRTLSFTATPTVGSYGTLVITQDATGGRTITLPSALTNKVLGSTSTTTVTLSSAAGAKDILNFYYDGTNCYWNVGQGYGTAATPAVTNLASSISGTLAVANGGTGATTLTGYVKGNGTTTMTASATIPVADVTGAAPLASPALTGTPTAPTATTGTNTTQVATTAFVAAAVASSGLPSQSGNNGKFLTTNGTTASWASGLSGSGTLNYIPRFSSSSALANSSLSDDGTGLRIGNPNGTNGIYTGLSSYDNTRLMVSGGREYESIRMTFPGDPYNNELSFNWYGSAWRMRTERSSGEITDLSFWKTTGAGVTTEKMRIDGDGYVKATGFKTQNGTSSQFLKANGTVDNTTYLSGTVAVANGGTGTTTLTGYVKGNGTSSMTASANIPVADVSGAAPLASPAFTGTPTAPTAAANTNNTQVATTAFVTSALSTAGLPSQSGNNGKFLTTNGSTASWSSSAGVPYSGASGAVNLGDYNLTVRGIKIGTSGTDNTALQTNLVIGRDALVNNTNGYNNMAIGNTALGLNVGGYNNVAIGSESQYKNLWGWGNVALGIATLNQNVTGNFNTAVGHGAGYFLTSSYNTAFGHNALDGQADGGGNTGVGVNAGGVPWNQRTYNSTFLGYNAKAQSGLDNVIVIGYNAYTNEHHTIQLGDNRIVKLKTSGTIWSNGSQLTSDARLKTNIQPLPNSIDLIMKLNPVHYTKKNSLESTDYAKTENGFIAQELQKVLPYLVIEGTDKDKILSVDYNSIIPVLTKGIQEQQLLIKAQQKQIDEMIMMLDKLIKEKK